MTLLSAYSASEVLGCVGWSTKYKLYSVGQRMAPCGTPASIGEIEDISNPDLTAKLGSLR